MSWRFDKHCLQIIERIKLLASEKWKPAKNRSVRSGFQIGVNRIPVARPRSERRAYLFGAPATVCNRKMA